MAQILFAAEKVMTEKTVYRAQAQMDVTAAAMRGIPELLRWAGIKEMPGYEDEEDEKRYQSLRGITQLVNSGRRPPEDLEELQRSVQICNDLNIDIASAMERAVAYVAHLKSSEEAKESNKIAPSQKMGYKTDHFKSFGRRMKAAREAKKVESLQLQSQPRTVGVGTATSAP